MKTLIFSPAAYNLAETTRTLEIAKACRDKFDILFVSYGGQFENLIVEEGFEVRHLAPRLTPEKIDYLYRVDQGQALGYFFSVPEVKEQVRNEIALFEKVKPTAVVTGFNFSNNISCQVAQVPLVWLTQSTWMMQAMFDAGLGSWTDMIDFPPIRWLPEQVLMWLSEKALAFANLVARPYDRVAQRYGLRPFRSMERLWEGDYNLLAEPEGFCELDLPPTYHCIGPLIGRLDVPIPDEILNMPKDRPIVYFAMGSSGQPQVIAKIIEGFAGKPYRVIAPVEKHLEGLDVQVPENVLVTDWLPAHKVNPMADISVIHGGIGTVMTACLAGKPVVGVAMMIEQEANIDCLVRKGLAIRIRKNRLTPEKLCEAIDRLLADKEAQEKARAFQKVVQKWDDPSIVARFFEETFGDGDERDKRVQ
jgi:UDP:flavonoid glycosyltransferase YjiC (YdhE family)